MQKIENFLFLWIAVAAMFINQIKHLKLARGCKWLQFGVIKGYLDIFVSSSDVEQFVNLPLLKFAKVDRLLATNSYIIAPT